MKDTLDKACYDKFCNCCGRKIEHVWKMIIKQPTKKKMQEWKGHRRYAGSNYYYDNNYCAYCENCGKKLEHKDFCTTWESRGEFWGAPCREQILEGYKCECGFTQKF